tara:strand:- start:837 stop:1202 length:366 start_codon:yes stop_codon:yes gene_type:complete
MNIIELNRLQEEINKPNFEKVFDKETITQLLEVALHANKKARQSISVLLNTQAKTIDAYRIKMDRVVERMYDLKHKSADFDSGDFIYNIMEDIFVNSIKSEDLDHDKIQDVSTEFQRKFNN